MNMIVAMDEDQNIGRDNKIPWGPLPTDFRWYLTHVTTTNDPLKRVALVLGRVTFEETIKHDVKFTSRWHFIVITRQTTEFVYPSHENIERERIDVVNSFDQAVIHAQQLLDTPSAMIESIFVFGGANPYEQALSANVVRRIYLTQIFAKFGNCDARVSNFDLKHFRRIKRSADELLAELDEQIIEENGWKYQFQVYESS
jgi:dihydrofolate reductase